MDHRYSILLVGASTSMAAVEAALQAEAGLAVRRVPAIPGETSRYDAMVVEARVGDEDVQAAVAAHPGLPVFRLDWRTSRLTMLVMEEFSLDGSSDLAHILRTRCGLARQTL
jgi:hypothetical protein